jgi:hypothetical protein
MTASGRLRRFCGFCGMSAYPPKLTVEADIPDQTASSSFDHLGGAREQLLKRTLSEFAVVP